MTLTKQTLNIEVPEQKIRVGGRDFVLREMSGKRMSEYIDIQAKDAERLRDAMASKDPAQLSAALEESLTANEDLFRLILGDYEPEWAQEHLTGSVRRQIVAVQDELNGMDAILGNLRNLLAATVEVEEPAE